MYTQVWGSGLQGEEAGLSLGPPDSDLQVCVWVCVCAHACVRDVGAKGRFQHSLQLTSSPQQDNALDPS